MPCSYGIYKDAYRALRAAADRGDVAAVGRLCEETLYLDGEERQAAKLALYDVVHRIPMRAQESVCRQHRHDEPTGMYPCDVVALAS